MLVFMYSTGYCGPICMKLELSKQIFGNIPKISNFIHIRPVGAELCGRTDRRTDGQTNRKTGR